MVREIPVLREPERKEFKTLYPNDYSKIVELQVSLNPRPRSPEEAKNNKFINRQILEIEEKIKNEN